jgi:hypothetical protein
MSIETDSTQASTLLEQLYAHWGKTMFPDIVLKLAIEGQTIKLF